MALIPAERLTPWTPGVYTGVIGGIPTDRLTENMIDITSSPYNADNLGIDDCTAAFNAAMAAAIAAGPSCHGVYIPAGFFKFLSGIGAGLAFSGKTVRGAGMYNTILKFNAYSGFGIGGSNEMYIPNPAHVVTTGLTKGSTVIGPAGTNWPNGCLLRIGMENDPSIPVVSTGGFSGFGFDEPPVRQWVKLTEAADLNLTFWPPLYHDYGGGSLNVRVASFTTLFPATRIGLEDLTVDMDDFTGGPGGAYVGATMAACDNCWFKNVRSYKTWNYGMSLGPVVNCEVRGCYAGDLKGSGSNGAGFLFTGSGCLIEDNNFVNANPNVEINAGSSGNVFSYNHGNGECNTNHAPHNRFNLHEGNSWAYQKSDGYFGGESELTLLRCNFHAQAGHGTVSLRRFNRRTSLIGCLHGGSEPGVGLPNIGNADFTGYAQFSLGDPWRDYDMRGELTTRTNDTQGQITLDSGALFYDTGTGHYFNIFYSDGAGNEIRIGNCFVTGWSDPIASFDATATLPPLGTQLRIGPGAFYPAAGGAGSFQEFDLDVGATLIDKGNYYFGSSTFTPLGGDALPESLLYTVKPAFFGGMAWPPYDPENPYAPEDAAASYQLIPAGFRFAFPGEEPPPPSSGGTATAVGITAGTLSITP